MYVSDERKAKKQEEKRQTVRLLSMISQFGINMLVPIFLCFFAGRWADRHFGTSYWTVVLFFIGAIAGFRNVYVFAKRYFANPRKDAMLQIQPAEEADIDEIKEGTGAGNVPKPSEDIK